MNDISEKGLIDLPLERILYLDTTDSLDNIYDALNNFIS